jgi:hypothetical protein
VVVTVGYPAETDPPSLRGDLADAVHDLPADRFGVVDPATVTVEVRYVAVERPPETAAAAVDGPPSSTRSATVSTQSVRGSGRPPTAIA